MLGAVLLMLANGPVAAVFEDNDVPDAVLAEQRGGIRLPNGIDATWSVNTTTAVNGAVVLQTVVKVDEARRVSTFAPASGQIVNSPAGQTSTAGTGDMRVSYDAMNGIQISSSRNPSGLSVTSAANGQTGQLVDGLTEVDLPQVTDNGAIRQVGTGSAQAIELQGQDLRVVHFTGNALGTAISNSGSDRTIDTLTTVSLDLRNAGPDVLGSAMFRVENVAIEALSSRF